jgi:diguanylate cyclase (GGDEF)-like protein
MKKILVIEDERILQKSLIKMLEAEGFAVITAENGNIGLKQVERHRPDLVLCDLMMPELDGYGVLQHLQADPNTATIPFICLTAREDRSALRRVMELGAMDYLTKPFTRAELIGAIATQLEKQERLQQQNSQMLQQMISSLNNQIYYDSLTNLPNRLLLRDQMGKLIQQISAHNRLIPLFVINLELSRFKDSLGLDCVDLLFEAVVERLSILVDQQGTTVRLNNEQLAILLSPLCNHSEIQRVSKIILDQLFDPFRLMGYELVISDASLGIAIYPHNGDNVDTLLTNANVACQYAKQQGGHCQEFYSEIMLVKSKDRLMLELDLRHAIDENQFEVYYQPQLDIATEKIHSLEALIRWQHPQKGRVSPADFIPIAEETGLVRSLDEWVLKTICEQAKQWHSQGFMISVAANLSAKHFSSNDVVKRIVNILETTQLDPRYLELELTETAVVKNPDKAIQVLKQLKALEIKLALDDFGTGYSSLSYLQQFPFDILKIDRSFVQNINKNTNDPARAIILATIQMAHSLNLKVVAEGVENETEYSFLKENNCDLIQGYWFSPPVPKAQLEEILSKKWV